MNIEPTKAYIYQPLPPQKDGKYFGVGGLHTCGLPFDVPEIVGVTKEDAEKIVNLLHSKEVDPEKFLEFVLDRISNDWKPNCGCRFESIFSNAVLICEKCSSIGMSCPTCGDPVVSKHHEGYCEKCCLKNQEDPNWYNEEDSYWQEKNANKAKEQGE